MKAFIARDSDSGLYLYYSNPYSNPPIKSEKILKTEKMWVSLYTPRNTVKIVKIDSMLFPEVKWEDEEPTEVTIEIVGKEEQQSQKQPKQQTKFDHKTLKPFDRVIVRNHNGEWRCATFSHIKDYDSDYRYDCCYMVYRYCIPYNDDTKHLVGTTDEAPEYYRYWED